MKFAEFTEHTTGMPVAINVNTITGVAFLEEDKTQIGFGRDHVVEVEQTFSQVLREIREAARS